MKRKDIVLIVAMVFVGGIISLIVSNAIFSSPKNRKQTAEVVDLITPDFPTPPAKYFNDNSVNATKH